MKSVFRFLTILVLALTLSQCKIAEKVTEPELSTLPTRYPATDSSSTQPLAWREYYTDDLLRQHIEEGLKGNLDLKIAMQRIAMANANFSLSKGALLPSLQGFTSTSQQRFGEYTMDGIGNFDTNLSDNIGEDKRIPVRLPDYYLGFQTSWEVDVWGKLRNQRRAAASRVFASEKAQHLLKTLVVAEIARLYYSLLALDNKLVIIRENIRLQQTAVTLITAQKVAGRATELAVKQFTAQLLNTQSLEALVQRQIIEKENMFNLMLGRYPQPVVRGRLILAQPMPEKLKTGVPAQLLSQRPDIRQSELQLAAARFDVNAARAAFLPSLNITGAWGMQAFNTQVLFNTPTSVAYNLLGGLTTPFFNKNAIRAQHRRASAAQLEAFYDYQKSILNGYQEVSTQLANLENLQRSYEFKASEVDTLTEGVATANDLFVAGLASYLEVVTAQKSVLLAELDAIDTREMQFKATVDLYKALGGGW